MTHKSTTKIVAGLLSLALVLTAVVVPAASADAQTTSAYTRNLTVGSTGADVTALQTTLSAKGYLSVAPTGYFGALTKAALAAWQASVGISPASGYFGPITRAYLATNGAGTSMTPGCVAGAMFSSTTGAPCTTTGSTVPGCTAGAMYSSTTGASCSSTTSSGTVGTWTPDGTDGSVTVSYVSFAPASQTLKKGDVKKPLISAKLQAVNGKVAVTRFDVHFSERPWLDFGSLMLIDSAGNVIATKTLSSAADVTEVTVGTDYLVRFDNISYVVTPGSDAILAVAANVLSASDKITGQTLYVGIGAGAIRTINGKGYTDSVGLTAGIGSGVTAQTGNSVTLSTTGSSATIFTRIDPTASATTRTVVTSTSQNTTDVVLGVFGLKAQNQSATINSLSFNINSSTGVATSTLLSNLRLKVGSQVYGANALTAGNTTFTNLSIPLTQDQWSTLTLMADINTNQTGVSASSTLVAASIVGVDSNFNSLILTSATNQVSTDNQYSVSGVNVSAASASTGTCSAKYANGINDQCDMTMSFTVSNVGNTNIFLSKNPAIALSTSSSPATASTTLQSINIVAAAGDTTSSYNIPSGASRTFTYSGTFSKFSGGGYETFRITAVKFGTSTTDGAADATMNAQTLTAGTNSAALVNFGLEPLFIGKSL